MGSLLKGFLHNIYRHLGAAGLVVGLFLLLGLSIEPIAPEKPAAAEVSTVLGISYNLNGGAAQIADAQTHEGSFVQFGDPEVEQLVEQPASIPEQITTRTNSPSLSVAPSTASANGALQIFGNKIVDATGSELQFQGVSVMGTEYACAQGWGIHDIAVNQNLITALKSWNVNLVRIPLNSYCWLGNGYAEGLNLNPAFSGVSYQNAIKAEVALLNNAGITALLDLHWTTRPDWGQSGGGQAPLPDQSAVDFWQSVGSTFKATPNVMYELFNEPFPESWENWEHCGQTGNCEQTSRTVAWDCWQNGCTKGSYEAKGMTQLLAALRAGGAQQPAFINGIEWANDAREIEARIPTDPSGNLGIGWHAYNFNRCRDAECWDREFATLGQKYPLLLTEFGQLECADDYNRTMLEWLDTQPAIHPVGWAWHVEVGCGGPALLSDYNGTPNSQGAAIKESYTTN